MRRGKLRLLHEKSATNGSPGAAGRHLPLAKRDQGEPHHGKKAQPRARGAAWGSPVGRYQSEAGRLRLSLQPVL